MAVKKKASKKGKRAVVEAVEPPHRLIVFALLSICAALAIWHLGSICIWEDEAQTAVVAKNILARGVPAASDGKNLVSIFPDHRDIRDGIYIWQGWLPSYLAAGSMAVFGCNAFGARFPFAAAFVGFIGFFYALLRRWHGDHNRHLWLTLALTLTCVPLLLHARQCRYYVLVPLLNLLIIDAYLRSLKERKLKHWIMLIVWATALVNSFFPGAVLLGVALGIDLIRRRPAWQVVKGLAIAAGIVLIVNLPMAWFCRIWDRRFGVQSGYDDPAVFGMYLLRYLLTLNNYFFPLSLVILACGLRWRAIVQKNVFKDELSFLFLVVCVTQVIGFSLLSDYPFTRYIIGIAPFLMFFGATCIEALSFNRTWLAWSIAIVVVGTNLFQVLPLPLLRQTNLQAARWTRAGINPEFLERENIGLSFAKGEVKELINVPFGFPLVDCLRGIVYPQRGPIDWIVEYLGKNAAPTDRVKISYGDLPLMFHTDLTIVSSTEVGTPAPEWMIFRHFNSMNMDEEFVRETSKYQYSKITIPFPDLQWNNQPDPLYHYNDPPSNDLAPPISLLRRQ
jgi:hypothetical protein